jgi:2-polyprenyl-3-methyl-5-hydroxy-6-metoxy-1,4-benzoquinol methylase
MEMIKRACPACGSADESSVFARANIHPAKLGRLAYSSRKTPEYMHYRLISCPRCDLLYANPLPPEGVIVSNYEAADYDSSVEARYAARTYADFLAALKRCLPDRNGVLDIGAGDGAFLEQLLIGGFRNVVGIEPSRAPVAAARESIRPLIKIGIFRAGDFAQESFSLVTCFHTLEHLVDPLGMCRNAFTMLKKGGAVLLICHNRRALAARLMGTKSPIFDIEHLQLFSRRSVSFLLKECGFEHIRIKMVVNKYPLGYWAKLLPLPSWAKSEFVNFTKRAGLGAIPLAIPAGNMAVVGYKP